MTSEAPRRGEGRDPTEDRCEDALEVWEVRKPSSSTREPELLEPLLREEKRGESSAEWGELSSHGFRVGLPSIVDEGCDQGVLDGVHSLHSSAVITKLEPF